ncbi:MAG: aldehyde dehydrogenase family protein [Calditrichaceae bacterium]|nr:aldehyde dehydrogenase family protein [Calditrichaceae bacterium]
MTLLEIDQIIRQQETYFQTGATKSLTFRLEQLHSLKSAITKYEDAIIEACAHDMGKPELEALMSEVALSLSETTHMIKNLRRFMNPKKIKTPIGHFPGKAFTMAEPFGRILIMAPWNYPFNLAIAPLIGSIAAGNCTVIKPSEITANVSDVIEKMVKEFFDPEYLAVIPGDAQIAQQLLDRKWDFIFFTGSPQIGRKVMQAAASHLTPVILELGGKSPCIVDKNINLRVAVKRIMHAKFFNCGQTCIAPDYLLVHKDIKEEFIRLTDETLKQFYGDYNNPNKDLARIVNDRHFDRLADLMNSERIILGGSKDRSQKFIAPTLIAVDNWNDKIMQEEIFGPLFPMMVYDNLDDTLKKISLLPKPLTFYFFSQNKDLQEKVLSQTSSGSLVFNDALVHFVIINLPFGGVGNSGMGNYHGELSFEAFSHRKSVLKKALLFDVRQRFAPYTLSRKQAGWLFKFFSG